MELNNRVPLIEALNLLKNTVEKELKKENEDEDYFDKYLKERRKKKKEEAWLFKEVEKKAKQNKENKKNFKKGDER